MTENEQKADSEKQKGILYIVSTPIGNQDDISLRALKILNNCDIVICEEIKTGARTLRNYNISKKLETLNEQNEEEKSFAILEMLKNGKRLALISDAGTPVFEDPGALLVRQALDSDIEVVVIPGPVSIMTALVRCGFSIKQFLYAGFLSRKTDERMAQLRRLSEESRTVAFLETPYRLLPILEAASKVMPGRRAYVGINLTMPYETHHYGTFKELYDKFSNQRFKGEFVICFEGASFDETFSSQTKREYLPKPGKKQYRGGGKPYRKFDGKKNFGKTGSKNFKRKK